jgi:PTS system ascorbate-specific IIC component
MWDWAVLWPVFTVIMKYLGYAGYALVVIFLIAIPQFQYMRDKKHYFLVTEDYDAYKKAKGVV